MPIIEYDNIMGIYKINFSNEKSKRKKNKFKINFIIPFLNYFL